MVSGQVYEVVFKNMITKSFLSYGQMKQARKSRRQQSQLGDTQSSQIFLIYILNKNVLINGENHVITFFKDITFGVLYEQIKAQ